MFSRKDFTLFIVAIATISVAYLFMAIDPQPNGFGPLTLWLAPPLLLIGFALPVVGIIGIANVRKWRIHINTARHLTGLAVGLVALITYWLTLEPTASLWDCSEFIAAAYKLQVPHTPGTPLSLLVGRIFTMFAPGATSVAYTLNFSSALFSALCAYLVYHIIYYFATRLLLGTTRRETTVVIDMPDSPMPILASALGSLVLVFSDTFWFSAVEAETYGIACFFLMALVALIIYGSSLEGEARDRRLILIGYLGGLSYCIHPMCVLALAILPFFWFARSNNALAIRNLMLLLSGLILVFLINRLVAIGIFELAFGADKFFVNSLGFPFYSGATFVVALLVVACSLFIRKLPRWRSTTWAVLFLIAGFTPYIMLFIRSNHNPPIDETNPEDLPMIKAYMNRESYPTSPLLFGPYFDAQVEDVAAGRRIFHRAAGKYAFSGTLSEYRFEKKRSTLLPRVYSNDNSHIDAYRQWLDLGPQERPDFSDNINFLFTYQLGHMYMRYLMFNFAGRESDRQNADWLRPWERSAPASKYASKARNQYWMLPLLAGIAGAVFQWRNDRRGFIAVLALFLITGLVLALYLNSPPVEPRERDYIYVASFIAFSIWIGLSVAAIGHLTKNRALSIPLAGTLAVGIPFLMAWQNFDDHDRSGRTFQVDNARNMLGGCAPNAILFTGGDNDTFPLWYLQEVEGFRTDVRVMVTSYLNTDWYINQLRKRYYNSEPFELTLNREDYLQYGPNDVLYIQETIKEGIDARRYLQLITENNPALRMQSSTGDFFTILPSKKLLIRRGDPLDQPRSALMSAPVAQDSLRNSNFVLGVKGNYATKSVLAMVDVMISNQWKRPIYFNFTSLSTTDLDLDQHVVQEGSLYRFDPMRASGDDVSIDRKIMYDNLITKADYSNLLRTDVHFNYEDFNLRMISPLRQTFNALAVSCLKAGDDKMARSVMQFALKHLYLPHLLPTYANLEAAELFSALGDNDSASALCTALFNCHVDELMWQQANGKTIDGLDRFLALQSAGMLASLGNTGPEQELKKMKIQ
jgi:hypothetical protein